MENETIFKHIYECKICGYTWFRNKKGIKPKTCANRKCRSYHWKNGKNDLRKYFKNPIKCYYSKTGCMIAISHARGKKQKYHKIARDGRQWLLHRWIFYIYNGYEPSVVMHTCDNTDCINPLHLVAGTQQENNLDMLNKGRTAKGERNGMMKLTEKQVIKIIDLINKGLSCRSISKQFNISSQLIQNIKNKKLWKHLKKNINQTKYTGKGESDPNSKLKEEDVIQIRKLLSQNISVKKIAEKYNVTIGMIYHIKKGRSWTYLK